MFVTYVLLNTRGSRPAGQHQAPGAGGKAGHVSAGPSGCLCVLAHGKSAGHRPGPLCCADPRSGKKKI